MRAERLLRYAACITVAVMMLAGCGESQNKYIVVRQEPDDYSTGVECVGVNNTGVEDTGNDSAVADSAVADSTVADSEVADSTAVDSTAVDGTAVDSTESDSTDTDSTRAENMGTDIENITCAGPYGSISIHLPDGWKYELRGVDDDKKFMSDYGIQFYPEGVKKGYVEIGYFASWGVCGTGLEEEKVTLAGDEAYVGYYDGSKIWDFVSYGGENEGVVALTHKADGWWDDYSEQVMTILDSLHFDSGETAGAIGVCNEESEVEDIALSVSARNISPDNATLVFNQYDDSINGELSFGEQYKIEKKIDKQKGSGWKEAEVVADGDYGFKDVANLIKKNGTVEHEYDWAWLYGSLEPGDYRIRIEVMASNEAGEYEKYPVCVYFVIR